MIEFLTPGQLVRSPEHPEWGLGQVQSVVDGKITVNFEEVGKVVINGDHVALEPV
ncbi:DUF3553 domain-containing protein [Neptunicoccus cionae]|uniref:DUF3553 domain-containing protein n=1 Tax=Neptunicoccus cionae TaxID=2035344 RepID=A0A916QWV1_9RHOB|nr:DUF3553 domain-containing protein [Amylibacter cionae]GGA14560.1 DUF3553 domain-containing protein [Amylibacter cionae]